MSSSCAFGRPTELRELRRTIKKNFSKTQKSSNQVRDAVCTSRARAARDTSPHCPPREHRLRRTLKQHARNGDYASGGLRFPLARFREAVMSMNGGGEEKMKAPAAEQQKGYFPPEQTLVLRPVDHHRKELLENAIMAESPPRKLSSVADKFRGSRTAVGNIQGSLLLMYANYGSAVEAQRAKVVRIHFVV